MTPLTPRIRLGSLDRRVRIEVETTTDDGYNEVKTWAELATVWAQVIHTAGQEARAQLGRDERLSASFRIRWSPKVAPMIAGAGSHQLRYPAGEDGQVWNILSAIEIGRREGIEIIATARVAAGG